jgi:hypothetical protein
MAKTVEELGIKGGYLARAGPSVLRIRIERVDVDGKRVTQSVTLGVPREGQPRLTHWVLKLTAGAARALTSLSADRFTSLT